MAKLHVWRCLLKKVAMFFLILDDPFKATNSRSQLTMLLNAQPFAADVYGSCPGVVYKAP